MAPPQARRSQGRKKIEMKLIPDGTARVVAFSKRLAGLFKKATELSVLCGVQIALVVFSPSGRAYSFGHPNVESVIDCFLNKNPRLDLQDSVDGARIHALMVQQLEEQYDKKCQEVHAAKQRQKEIEAALESSGFGITQEYLKQLNLHQLNQLKQMLEKLRRNACDLVSSLQTGSVEPSCSTDSAGPSDPKKVVEATFQTPCSMNVAGPSDPKKVVEATFQTPCSTNVAGPSDPKKVVEATFQTPCSTNVAGPSNPEKAVKAPIEGNGHDASPPLPLRLRLEKVDLAKFARDGHDASSMPPAGLRSKMVVERDERDASPIPPDWLSL